MFAAATSFFARTNIGQNYNIGTQSRPATPATPSTSLAAPVAVAPPFFVGLWRVQSAWHKTTNKRVSVWVFDKRGPDIERLAPQAKDRAVEVLKAEASALSRFRHPSILEMVEPMEETRIEIMFATEPVLSSLELSVPDSSRRSSLVELDEVEIQKGIIQLCKGLTFLHNSARLIHSNLRPETVIINGAGDWKISGLGLTIPLQSSWEFPTYDGRMPSYIQRSFDYMAPEYALDEQLVAASDMYSLGCLIYAVHMKGSPPFKNHGSLGSLRDNANKPPPVITQLDGDLQGLLRSLITRHYGSRPTPDSLPSQPFFSSLPISTLNFLDRSNFTAKTREEKISFMKGLTGVLDRFTDGLRTRKILPSLLEEMKDTNLLPYILPNVFSISQTLSPPQFASTVLPSLKPLFAIKEPPQNMLTLLDNLTMLQDKTEKNIFREHVLPLVYNALESEHAIVQERALKMVPGLCDTIDYAEVQGVIFPRVALVFTKTRILSVKVATLDTFLTMVKTLDQSSLTQKMVPLLSKIRTKEPAVMMATLSVQEAMGFKVDREAVATLVLPQLWAMSMGPLLSVGQFQRFMSVIKKLGERVEKEHDQFLRDSQRLEDRSGILANGAAPSNQVAGVDFESLVGRSSGIAPSPSIKHYAASAGSSDSVSPSWNDDVWGSIFNDPSSGSGTPITTSPPLQPAPPSTLPAPTVPIVPARSSFQARPSRLSGTSSIQKAATSSPSQLSLSTTSRPSSHSRTTVPNQFPSPPRVVPSVGSLSTFPPPAQSQTNSQSTPNYNLSLEPSKLAIAPSFTTQSVVQPSIANTPPFMAGGLLVPSKPAKAPSNGMNGGLSKDDWASFDPLS